MTLAWAMALTFATGLAATARADGWHIHPTLPPEVPAYNYATGGEYFAPPVPYGHYAKDPHGELAKSAGMAHGMFKGLLSKCTGLFHHGDCNGGNCGSGNCGGGGCGHGMGGGCGFCAGKGLFHHGSGLAMADPCSTGKGCGLRLGHKKSFAPCHPTEVMATSQAMPAAQAVVTPSMQSPCGDPGCKVGGIHSHLANLMNKIRCHRCGGGGCGLCGGAGVGDPCSSCGGNGCGKCGGCGLLNHAGGLGSKAHGLLGTLTGLLHPQKFDYFVGAGGPVPLTPGYVPYIVTTRSPRDFFAFPPMNPNDP